MILPGRAIVAEIHFHAYFLNAEIRQMVIITICAPMIYTALCIMFWMRAYTLRGEVGGGWALEFPNFLGPVKWERDARRVPFGAQKIWVFSTQLCELLPL